MIEERGRSAFAVATARQGREKEKIFHHESHRADEPQP